MEQNFPAELIFRGRREKKAAFSPWFPIFFLFSAGLEPMRAEGLKAWLLLLLRRSAGPAAKRGRAKFQITTNLLFV